MESVAYWFNTEISFWRSAGSLFWSVALLVFSLTELFVLLSHFSVFQPWLGLTDGLSVILSVSFFLCLVVLVGVLVAIFYTSTFAVIPDVASTRLQSYLSLLRWSRWPHLAVSCIGGACVAWCCSHFLDARFYGLTGAISTADREIMVLNESHLFLVLSGLVAGLVYYCNFHLSPLSYLTFPSLQRDKYFRARSGVTQLATHCLRLTWYHVRVFYFGYWIFGGMLRSWVMGIINIDAVRQPQTLDSMVGLLDFGLLWQSSLLAFFIIFSWSLMAVLYGVYHTQRLEIPLLSASTFSTDSKHSLTEALVADSEPLLQHLAFLDLTQLSAQNRERRQEVLSLSQPGGHPHTWRAVCGACLLQVDSLAAQVHHAHLTTLAALPIHTIPAEKIFQSDASVSADTSAVYRSSHSVLQSPCSSGVQNLTLQPLPQATQSSIFSKVYSGLKNKPGLSYFLMELPDSKSRQLFANCQTRIWAIEALSMLAAASYQEDKYGVVQQSLSAIFSSLIMLQDNIEKYFKLQPLTWRRGSKEVNPAPHVALCHQLRTTLKTALYRLTNTFGKHIGDLQLSGDCMKRVKPFLDYRE